MNKNKKDDLEDDYKPPTLDQLADYLEEEHLLLSDGKSFAIMSMVDFYRKIKELTNE